MLPGTIHVRRITVGDKTIEFHEGAFVITGGLAVSSPKDGERITVEVDYPEPPGGGPDAA